MSLVKTYARVHATGQTQVEMGPRGNNVLFPDILDFSIPSEMRMI
jgi:hypothetical protein